MGGIRWLSVRISFCQDAREFHRHSQQVAQELYGHSQHFQLARLLHRHTPIRSLSSSPSPSNSRFPPSRRSSPPLSQFERACSLILLRRPPSEPIEITLQNAQFPLTPPNLSLLLSRLRSPKDALRIFLIFLNANPSFAPGIDHLNAVSRFWFHEKERFPVFLAILQELRKPNFVMTPRRLTAVIRGYGWAGLVDEVLQFLSSSKTSFGFQPDFFHFSCALHICIEEKRLDIALQIFRQMDEDGCSPTIDTFQSLIAGLIRAKRPKDASLLFVQLVSRHLLLPGELPPNIASYITIVHALIQSGDYHQALLLVVEMKDNGYVPDCITCTSILEAISSTHIAHPDAIPAQTLNEIYDEMKSKELLPDVTSFKDFVRVHCKGETSSETQEMFSGMIGTFDVVTSLRESEMEGSEKEGTLDAEEEDVADLRVSEMERSEKEGTLDTEEEEVADLALFDHVVYGLSMHEKSADAYELMLRMTQHSGIPTKSTSMLLFDALSRSCMWEEAEHVLRMMMTWGYSPDLKTYNFWIQGACRAGHVDKVYLVLNECSRDNLVLDAPSFNVVVDKLCLARKLEEAKKISFESKKSIRVLDVVTYSRMIYSFAKAGDFDVPRRLLEEMVEMGFLPFAQPFTPLIDNLCKGGKMDEALSLLDDLVTKGCNPISSLYTYIVRAYCERNQLETAFKVIDTMKSKGITPEVKVHKVLFESCMIAQKSKPEVKSEAG